MIRKISIKIRKRTPEEWLLWFIIVFPLIGLALIDFLHIPYGVKYLVDVALVVLFCLRIRNLNRVSRIKRVYVWIAVFFTYALILYIINYQSLFYYLWGSRNNFRFYVFFILCVIILKKREVIYFYKLFDITFGLNVVVCTVQYFILNIKQDNLGGLFGTSQGCNGYMNIFLVIILAKSILMYLNKKENILHCLLIVSLTVYIATLAEMKFYFAEVVLVVAVSVLITDFSWRKFLLVIASVIALVVGVTTLVSIFPEWDGAFSIKGFLSIATSESGYTGSGDLNRLTAIKTISTKFLNTPSKLLFGYGLGNCDFASFNIVTTPFYLSYSWLHYTWMSSSFIFFEMGAIGLFFFFGFFVLVFILARKSCKDSCAVIEAQLAQVIAISCIVIGIYNSSLRMEAAYMAYFIMSLPFISDSHSPCKKVGENYRIVRCS